MYDITEVEDKLKNMKILVVDDDTVMSNVIRKILEEKGYKTFHALSGKIAFDMIKTVMPDVILMDVLMPGMDGFEVCRQIKNNPHTKHIPVIFITVKSDTDDMVEGFKTGCVDYITKPFRKEDICSRVKTHLYTVYLRKEVEKQFLLKGVVEMAGATAHELNQPLSVILGNIQLMLLNMDEKEPKFKTLNLIQKQTEKMADIIRKITNITRYEAKEYVEGYSIVDIDKSSNTH